MSLPDAPDAFTCSITCCRMVDPVFTADGHSYERSAIEEWFKNKATSPKTGLPLSSKVLLPNLTLQSQINEWKDDQLKGRADKQNMNALRGRLFGVSTSKEAQVVVQQMIQLKKALRGLELLDKDLSNNLDLLASQCQGEINTKQERHRELNTKCVGLDLAKTNVLNKD